MVSRELKPSCTLQAVHASLDVERLAEAVQEVTGQSVEIAYVDQGYGGAQAETGAARHGIQREVVRLPEAKRGIVLLPCRWVVERSFSW
jgi:hypothetical protein